MKRESIRSYLLTVLLILSSHACDSVNGREMSGKNENRVVSQKLYGFNTVNMFLSYDVETGSNISLNDIDPQFYRFPGGTIANFYHPGGEAYGFDIQKDKITKHDKMLRRYRRFRKEIREERADQNYIYDLKKLVPNVAQKKLLYVANLIDGTPEEAVWAIDFCIESGFDLVGIELGNELYAQRFLELVPDVEMYIEEAKKFASVFRESYPDVPLSVVGAPVNRTSRIGEHRFEVWNRKLANEVFYDAVVHHPYPNVSHFEKMKDEVKFEMAADFLIDYITIEGSEHFEKFRRIYGEDVNLWLTEWSLTSVPFGNSMLQALYSATFLSNLPSVRNVSLASFHTLIAEFDSFAVFAEEENQFQDRPFLKRTCLYYPFFMLNEIFDGTYSFRSVEYVKDQKLFTYQFRNLAKKNFITVVINWSDTTYEWEKIGQSRKFDSMEELYGKSLRSTTKMGDELFYTSHNGNQEFNFLVKPFSITKIVRAERE